MTVTLSPPVRVFAFAGVLVAIGLAGFSFVLGRGGDATSATATRTFATATQATASASAGARSAPSSRPRRPAAAALPASGFPLPVHRALRRNAVVVVVVYMPRASVDRVVRTEARAAARASGAGLVQLSALSGRLMRPLIAKAGILPDPAVLVVKRPDVVAATFGVTDRQTILQAVAQARK